MARKRTLSPEDLEREEAANRRREVDRWWCRFERDGPFAAMAERQRGLSAFAVYVTREYLFRAHAGPKDCHAVTLEHVKTFFLDSAPHYVVVDDPRGFVQQAMAWLEWLASAGVLEHSKEIARGLRRGAWRRDIVDRIAANDGSPSKELVVRAREAGIDVGDQDALLDFLYALRPGDPRWAEYCREFAAPPHPTFDRGRALYTYDWPPTDPDE